MRFGEHTRCRWLVGLPVLPRHKGPRTQAATYAEFGESRRDDDTVAFAPIIPSSVAQALATVAAKADVHGAGGAGGGGAGDDASGSVGAHGTGEEEGGSGEEEGSEGSDDSSDQASSGDERDKFAVMNNIRTDFTVPSAASQRSLLQAPCTLVKPTGVTTGVLYILRGGEMVWEPTEGLVADSDSLKVADRPRRWRAHDIYGLFMRHYRLRDSALEVFLREFDGRKKQYFFSFTKVREQGGGKGARVGVEFAWVWG